MPGRTKHDYREEALDPHILSTPFKVQTNWHVITGASCSGKTTLIQQLAGEGFQTVPEVARRYFGEELAKGRTIDEIRQDQASISWHIHDLLVKTERGLRAVDFTFLDRALPDILTFYRYAGMNPNDILLDCYQYRYASVFMLDRFPYQRDGVRTGDDAYAEYFDSWMFRDYNALGYNVLRVPVLPPEERLAFVLERLSERGLV
jgi:predicted ATPase